MFIMIALSEKLKRSYYPFYKTLVLLSRYKRKEGLQGGQVDSGGGRWYPEPKKALSSEMRGSLLAVTARERFANSVQLRSQQSVWMGEERGLGGLPVPPVSLRGPHSPGWYSASPQTGAAGSFFAFVWTKVCPGGPARAERSLFSWNKRNRNRIRWKRNPSAA